jgi:hypothetical protein
MTITKRTVSLSLSLMTHGFLPFFSFILSHK